MKKIIAILLVCVFIGCNSKSKNSVKNITVFKVIGAMKNVMWKGELEGIIYLDTISNKKGLYGLGPISYLTGELLINNGESYLSKVTSDSTMVVEKSFDVSAPFFVYTNETDFGEFLLPNEIKSIKELEVFIDKKTSKINRPFVFKLIGNVLNAKIHVQNLPEGSKVSSPNEAHVGQTNYTLKNVDSEIIGFFSTEHKGIFTHHDSFLHMHLITKDKTKMGHLDAVEFGNIKLFLPKK
jgi:acetolactate decarboxylase